MVNEKLLEAIARELYDETGWALSLAGDTLCSPLIAWQLEQEDGQLFRYPEPFNRAVSGSCTVLFLGLGSSYRPDVDAPGLGASFEDYHNFYKTRLHEIRASGFPARRTLAGSLRPIDEYKRIEQWYLSTIQSPAGPLMLGDNCMYADTIPFKAGKWGRRNGARGILRMSGRWPDAVAAYNRRIERLIEATEPTLTVVQRVDATDLFPELEGVKMADAPILSIRRGNVEFAI